MVENTNPPPYKTIRNEKTHNTIPDAIDIHGNGMQ